MSTPYLYRRNAMDSAMRIAFRTITVLSLLVPLTFTAAAPRARLPQSSVELEAKSVESRMSSMGLLAQRVQKQLAKSRGQAFGVSAEDEECVDTPDDCEDGFT